MGWAPLVGRPADYLPPGTVGQWYLPRAMADRAQGRRPDNRPGGDDSDPGLASRRERGLTARRSTLTPAWSASMRKGAGARRRGAICFCELSRQLQARSGKTDGEDRPTSMPSSSTVVIQFIDKVLNFPVVLRKRRIFPFVTFGTPSLKVMVFVYPFREAKLSNFFCGAGPPIAEKKKKPRTQRLRIFSARSFCT